MVVTTSYRVDIMDRNRVFLSTLEVYRRAVDFLIDVCLNEWTEISGLEGQLRRVNHTEKLIHRTKKNPSPRYERFDVLFYKLPSYVRRSAIADALGLVSSHKTNHNNQKAKRPRAGSAYPCMYRDGMYTREGEYTARLKVFIRNTWDWITVTLNKQDVDYLKRRFGRIEDCAPYLVKHGRKFSLRFAFREQAVLSDRPVFEKVAISVDLGINNACVISAMKADGTILGRHFLSLPGETDSLRKAIGRIKKAQKHGARRMPRLWALAQGINKDIAVKTAKFIVDTASRYDADVIVFEYLDLGGKKRGSKKQKLALWKALDVQNMVTVKAHVLGMRVSRVNAWETSKYAFDGSGTVTRDRGNYSMCTFASGKRYHADLSASYNIGARYFIREILKTLPERVRHALEAKVPQAAKRSTCTLSTLISLYAALGAEAPGC